MIDEHRQTKDALPAAQDAAGRDLPAMTALSGAAVSGEIQDTVDPFDYAETIVRDLALHVGTRLRDFRDDLAAMHATVVQLPETMRINAMGQSIQELRDRVAHLTGVVSLQATRPAEEAERLGRGMNDLAQRVAGLEAWIAAAKRAGVQNGELPAIPLPEGGLVGMEQFDRVIDQMHESFVKLVGAVRELQLDLRDLRSAVRDRGASALPRPEPAPAPLPAPVSAPTPAAAGRFGDDGDDPAGLASLAFGVWHRLSQPAGSEALQAAVDDVLRQLSDTLPGIVRQPRVTKGSGLVAVCSGRVRGVPAVALVATEDLCGHRWTLAQDGAEMAAEEPQGLVRTPCWRALLATAALLEQARPGTVVLPVLVYGNGWLDRTPTREEILSHGRSVVAERTAGRMIGVAAAGIELPGLLRPADVGRALAGAF